MIIDEHKMFRFSRNIVLFIVLLVVFRSVSLVSAQQKDSKFLDALISQGPSPKMPPSASGVFDRLIGDWEVEVYDYGPQGSKHVSRGEWHFRWVLEGRAVQDVWIVPKRSERKASTSPEEANRYGTTLRIYDPQLEVWHVFWFNPVTQDRTELVGRKVGDTIVQQCVCNDGSFTRWTFEDITPNSFTWRGEFSTDGGKTWQLDAEFLAHRMRSEDPN